MLTTSTSLPSKVSFAYVDFDFYEPILLALNFIHPIMDPGGIMIVDDYNFFSTGSKTEVDEWVAEQNATSPVYELTVPDEALGYFAVLRKLV